MKVDTGVKIPEVHLHKKSDKPIKGGMALPG
jgi:hypothetical protein